MSDEKQNKKKKPKPQTIQELKSSIENDMGKGSIMLGLTSIVDVEAFPTNIPTLDVALGVLGIPAGRIIELYGAESSGKTTTCLQIIAACQNHTFPKTGKKGVAAFIDAEHAFDPEWAKKVGVNVEELIIAQPDSGEDAFQLCDKFVESELVNLIIVDSVAALAPQKMLDAEVDASNIGAQARMMSQGLNKIKGKAYKSGTTIIFINQIREKVGIQFGSPETTPGGRALKFYSTIRISISKGSAIKSGDTTVGFRPTAKISKNKVAPPFQSASYDICFGLEERPIFGIDKYSSLIEVAQDLKLVNKKGNFYSIVDNRELLPIGSDVVLGNGMAKVICYLQDNPGIYEELRNIVYKTLQENKKSLIKYKPQKDVDEEDEGDLEDDA